MNLFNQKLIIFFFQIIVKVYFIIIQFIIKKFYLLNEDLKLNFRKISKKSKTQIFLKTPFITMKNTSIHQFLAPACITTSF